MHLFHSWTGTSVAGGVITLRDFEQGPLTWPLYLPIVLKVLVSCVYRFLIGKIGRELRCWTMTLLGGDSAGMPQF